MREVISGIIEHIEASEASDYRSWYIGVTQNIEGTCSRHGRPPTFAFWEAHSLSEARAIAVFFIEELAMSGEIPSNLSPNARVYVYIFQKVSIQR